MPIFKLNNLIKAEIDIVFDLSRSIVDILFLKSYLKRFLEKRNEIIKQFAESDQWKELLN